MCHIHTFVLDYNRNCRVESLDAIFKQGTKGELHHPVAHAGGGGWLFRQLDCHDFSTSFSETSASKRRRREREDDDDDRRGRHVVRLGQPQPVHLSSVPILRAEKRDRGERETKL